MTSQWSELIVLPPASELQSSPVFSLPPPVPTLGTLSFLPTEIRLKIYTNLLVSRFPSITTFGSSSIISTSILRCSSAVYHEALPILYDPPGGDGHVLENSRSRDSPHALLPFASMPRAAMLRMRRLTLRINFSTLNRGDCETEVLGIYYVRVFAEAVAFALRSSSALRYLRIELLNASQRKSGPKRLRSATVRDQIRGVLALFATCVGSNPSVRVDVGGFDTLEYVEIWDELIAKGHFDENAVGRLIEYLANGPMDQPPAYS